MMFFIYKFIGSLISPPGFFCLVLLFCTLTALRRPSKILLAYTLLFLSIALWFISTPIGASCITGQLEDMYPRKLPDHDSPVAVIVLSGGSSYNKEGDAVQPGIYTLERVYCAVNLLKERGGTLIFTGGNVYGFKQKSEAEIMADCAKKLGWKGKIILEKKSRTTKENLILTAKILKAENIDDFVLVTNAFHMPRSMYCATKTLPDSVIYPYSSGRTTDPVFRGSPHLLPGSADFASSCLGIKEWIGLAAYRIF